MILLSQPLKVAELQAGSKRFNWDFAFKVSPLGDATLQALSFLQELVKMQGPGDSQLQALGLLKCEHLSVPCPAGLHREYTHCLST